MQTQRWIEDGSAGFNIAERAGSTFFILWSFAGYVDYYWRRFKNSKFLWFADLSGCDEGNVNEMCFWSHDHKNERCI